MRTLLLILFIAFSLKQQTSFNYKKERSLFNISLIATKQSNILVSKKINDNEKFQGRYLGMIRVKSKQQYHIVASSYIYNIKNSPTAESQIFIYNNEKRCLGFYYLTLINELPQKIINNELLFKSPDCKNPIVISFKNGIPKTINLRCNDEDNLYEFSPE
ncbi:hypothetical protein [Mucilaginibacter flavidus]|uniref:hypothetical protein n=1 Tax=Mucilaginibacter flavidus TaxID=2949309 RepID=UPI0020926157|nr:hypothetical protein [Mucilaginibacter flavidus]MCO5947479.1 hypothetical protein [Mucilaginibacter flavidus]